MSGGSPPTDNSPSKRLKLVLKTSEDTPGRPSQIETVGKSRFKDERESSSPPRPSFSPVTPTLSHTSLNGQEQADTQWIDEPQPLPVSLDENADAIALKATISLLQMQRQQSIKDIRNLDKMKNAALEDPEAFVQDLRSGKLKTPTSDGVVLDYDEEDDLDQEAKSSTVSESKFGKIPNSQNVARCPPVEWSKYHVLGQPLDSMHELQQRHPGITEEALAHGAHFQQHDTVAPYRPFVDRLQPTKEKEGYEK